MRPVLPCSSPVARIPWSRPGCPRSHRRPAFGSRVQRLHRDWPPHHDCPAPAAHDQRHASTPAYLPGWHGRRRVALPAGRRRGSRRGPRAALERLPGPHRQRARRPQGRHLRSRRPRSRGVSVHFVVLVGILAFLTPPGGLRRVLKSGAPAQATVVSVKETGAASVPRGAPCAAGAGATSARTGRTRRPQGR